MKSQFSKAWKSSKQARKQRKYIANAPLHIKSKLMGVHLSKELRKKYRTRSISVRKGDEVKVITGSFKKSGGKISLVNYKKQRVAIEGLQKKKKDGTKINLYFNPSNLQIQALNESDKKRIKKFSKKPEENAPKKT